ncbi:hypothetical protein K3495_g15741 [Podosphaera aphanis]|nr:hypothetical protein K3495_g15741 [Podosphaera aphanis]
MNNIEKRAIRVFALKDTQTVDEQELLVEQRRLFLGRVKEIMRACKTPDEFEPMWAKLYDDYHMYEDLISYLNHEWKSCKEEWCSAWINRNKHFNNTVTSRLEGAHQKMKGYLQSLTSDLFKVKSDISLLINNKYTSIMQYIPSQFSRKYYPAHAADLISRHTAKEVSHKGLDLLLSQIHILEKYMMNLKGIAPHECHGLFTATNGLPCWHSMYQTLQRDSQREITMSTIHPQWHFRPQAEREVSREY